MDLKTVQQKLEKLDQQKNKIEEKKVEVGTKTQEKLDAYKSALEKEKEKKLMPLNEELNKCLAEINKYEKVKAIIEKNEKSIKELIGE